MADGKCPPCKAGAPAWMASFADMCTLLLTFFVLLLSFAKTETAKYEAAMGSIRNAFGGNVLKAGETTTQGKSPSDSTTMIESDQPPRPFPIEFLTSEGLLDKQEINRESDTQLNEVKKMLTDYNLSEEASVFEMPESITVRMKDKFSFNAGSVSVEKLDALVFDRILKMLRENPWHIIVEGHAAVGEANAWSLSAQRASAVAQLLMARGVSPERVSVISYGDSRPQPKTADVAISDRRVEFVIRKLDLRTEGRKVRGD
ncbi:MAG: flagellar motor protein MotB [Bacteriovoracia bacterium]